MQYHCVTQIPQFFKALLRSLWNISRAIRCNPHLKRNTQNVLFISGEIKLELAECHQKEAGISSSHTSIHDTVLTLLDDLMIDRLQKEDSFY